MAQLLGTHPYQMDPKGRVSLPSKWRDVFDDGAYITLGQDNCLYAYPRDEWERRAGEARERPLSDAQSRHYGRMFFGGAEEVTLDAQGRLVVPRRLREKAGLRQEVVVVGVFERLEIWDRAEWERYEAVQEQAYRSGSLGPV